MSDKPLRPSAKKLNDARKKGQFARSRLLTGGSALVGALVGLQLSLATSVAKLQQLAVRLFSGELANFEGAGAAAGVAAAWLVGPLVVGALAGGLFSSAALAGFHFEAGLVAPKFERVDPAEGFQKLLSQKQLLEALKGVTLIAVVLVGAWAALRGRLPELFALASAGMGQVAGTFGELFDLFRTAAWMLLGIGVADYLWARHRHFQELGMSHAEAKREHRESEGDPHQKAKRKALARQFAAGGPARGLTKASVVVVNPTHIAVALRFDDGEASAPYLVAKAREEDALALKAEAKRLGIPVVKDIPLARSLIHFDVGEEVPEELYQAAAAVLQVALDTNPQASTRRDA